MDVADFSFSAAVPEEEAVVETMRLQPAVKTEVEVGGSTIVLPTYLRIPSET
jgi:hypothetical protein